jgi:hypothetical protein
MADTPQEVPAAAPDPRIAATEQALEESATPLRPDAATPNKFEREFRAHDNKARSADAAEGTTEEARVAGELASEAEQERIDAEKLVARLRTEAPGSPALADAEQALARIEADATAADAASLDVDEAASDAVTDAARKRRANAAADEADYVRGTTDVAAAGRDLTDEEAAVSHLEADRESIEGH